MDQIANTLQTLMNNTKTFNEKSEYIKKHDLLKFIGLNSKENKSSISQLFDSMTPIQPKETQNIAKLRTVIDNQCVWENGKKVKNSELDQLLNGLSTYILYYSLFIGLIFLYLSINTSN